MKKIFSQIVGLSFISLFVYAQNSLDEVVAKIKNPNPNIIVILKKIDYDVNVALNAYPGKMQFDQMKKAIESAACLNTFGEEPGKEMYKDLVNYLEPKFKSFDLLVKKYSEDKVFKDQLSQFRKDILTIPQNKVCRFEFVKYSN